MNMQAFFAYNLLYLVPTIVINLSVFLLFYYRFKMRNWYVFDLIGLLIPGLLYSILEHFRLHRLFGNGKTLANLVELFIISLGCSVIFLIRAIKGKNIPQESIKYSIMGMIAMLILTIVVETFFPALQE